MITVAVIFQTLSDYDAENILSISLQCLYI